MRVFITGIGGFVGSRLARYLLEQGDQVSGTYIGAPPRMSGVAHVDLHEVDLLDLKTLKRAVGEAEPDALVNLAGLSSIGSSWKEARMPDYFWVNLVGTENLLAAAAGRKVVIASSADVYGAPDSEVVDERAPLRPANVYAATKVASEALVHEFAGRRAAATTVLRPANQIGPRQHPGLAASAFAKQIAEAEAGLAEPVVRHGLLDPRRDFLDVRDMAAAYAFAADLSEPGATVYNVGTGQAVSVAEILETLIRLARVPMRAELDPERVRSGAAATFALDSGRFRRRTGWAPKIDLRTSLADTLEYWRGQVRAEVRA